MEERIQATISTASSAALLAETFVRTWPTSCHPCLVMCDDGNSYVIKCPGFGRAVCNDQIVARLGIRIGAPVAPAAIVRVTPELLHLNPQMSHMLPGLAHATRFLPDQIEGYGVQFAVEAANRKRFARLRFFSVWSRQGMCS